MVQGREAETRPTRVRFVMLSLLATGTLINYLDRAVLGIAAPSLSRDLTLDPRALGLVFSAFSWSYAALQIPGGIFLDRFGSRLTYMLSVTAWSTCTLLQSAVGGLAGLLGLRVLLGISESPCFPTNSRVVATWFPQQERAFATSIYTVGEYAGLAFLSPVLFWMLGAYGWRVLFVASGVLGLLFAVVWWRVYRSPADSRRVNELELDHIRAGGGLLETTSSPHAPFDWRRAAQLMRHRQMWGICLGQFAGNSTLVFFLTWFPTYLATERHMDWVNLGWFSVVPFLAASAGVLIGGRWSDGLLHRGASANKARKLPITCGLLLASTIALANFFDSDLIAILFLSLAFFAQGIAALGWTLVADIAPEGMLGVTGGVFNLFSNLAGILTPIVVGGIAHATGSFVGALAYVSGVALMGALAYAFLLGDVKRISLAA